MNEMGIIEKDKPMNDKGVFLGIIIPGVIIISHLASAAGDNASGIVSSCSNHLRVISVLVMTMLGIMFVSGHGYHGGKTRHNRSGKGERDKGKQSNGGGMDTGSEGD